MKVYVASAFGNREEVKQVMAALRILGHKITHDWTNEAIDPAWPREQQETYLQDCGASDLAGVLAADVLVLVNHQDCRDAMTEFGIAIGVRAKTYVLYPERRNSVFFHRAVLCSSIPELLGELEYAYP